MNNLINSVGILGIGSSLPDKVLTNEDLEKMVDTSDEWITQRTGISQRRILEEDEPAYTLGVKAAVSALEDAGITAEDVNLIIVTTETPDYMSPSTSCIIQREIGASKAAAFDLNAACTGFMYGMTVAEQFVKTGYYKYVLVVGVEALSKATDWEDRNTCILFGDGAGAAVVGAVEDGYGILSTYLGADGSMGHNITIPGVHSDPVEDAKRIHGKKHTIWMDGGAVLKFAVKIMESATNEALDRCGLSIEDINLVVPHQANIRIVEGAAKRLGVSRDKVMISLDKLGNISSASIPVALNQAVKEGKLSKGDNVVLVGFGGGLTWGSTVIKWAK